MSNDPSCLCVIEIYLSLSEYQRPFCLHSRFAYALRHFHSQNASVEDLCCLKSYDEIVYQPLTYRRVIIAQQFSASFSNEIRPIKWGKNS